MRRQSARKAGSAKTTGPPAVTESAWTRGGDVNGAKRVAFVSADDADAKTTVGALLRAFGFAVIDLGNLRDGGLIQQAGGPLAGLDILQRL